MHTWIAPTFSLGVFAVWAGTALAGSFTSDWTGFQVATPVMILVSGYVVGVRIIRGNNNGGSHGRG